MNCTPLLKGIFVTFFFCFLFLNSHAQTKEDTSTYKFEFGLDANFINNFLPLENPIGRTGAYLFSYREYRDSNKYTRVGMNLNFSGIFDKAETDVEREIRGTDIDLRIGWGKHRSIFKNTVLYSGWDIVLGYDSDVVKVKESGPSTNDGNDKTSYKLSAGFGPFMGIQYNFNKRFGIYTEATFYILSSYEIEQIKFQSSSRTDSKDTKLSYFSLFRLPRNLVIFYKF